MNIKIKNEQQIKSMIKAGNIVGRAHREVVAPLIKAGTTTIEVDKAVADFIASQGATASFLGYGGFPNSICISINNVLIHGIPSNRELVDGDSVAVDIGAYIDGYHGDAAKTYFVGEVSAEDRRISDVASLALDAGLKQVKPGNSIEDISKAIYQVIDSNGFYTPKDFTGHGVGSDLHEDPYIPNFASGMLNKVIMQPGMTLAIEPMLLSNSDKTMIDPFDKWTVYAKDGGRCAHTEHTVLVTEDGYKILTE